MGTSTVTYSLGEEIANSISHGIGVVLAIAALGILTAFAGIYGRQGGFLIYPGVLAVFGDIL